MPHAQPIATVDIVMFTLILKRLHVLLVKRDKDPFKSLLALPGGYVHVDEDKGSLEAARRTLESKTLIKTPYLEQLYTFAGPDRDPRGWSFSVAHYALVREDLFEGGKAAASILLPVDEVPQLAFDHNRILDFALKRLRDKSSYSTLPFYLLPEKFTLPQVQDTYQIVMGESHDKRGFRRWLNEFDILEELPGEFRTSGGRPAQLYQLRNREELLLRTKPV